MAAQRTGEGPPKAFVRHLRKEMTEPERKLWAMLKDRRFESFKFRRQVPLGRYVVDFACFEKRLIVEADGGQHSESAHDETRDAWLRSQGFRVLRFWNSDIHHSLDVVMMTISGRIEGRPLIRRFAPPSPARGEGKGNIMTRERIYLFDTTLRDGQQTPGVDFSLEDKLVVMDLLDQLGVDYIEGGYPGGNPTDTALFATERPRRRRSPPSA